MNRMPRVVHRAARQRCWQDTVDSGGFDNKIGGGGGEPVLDGTAVLTSGAMAVTVVVGSGGGDGRGGGEGGQW